MKKITKISYLAAFSIFISAGFVGLVNAGNTLDATVTVTGALTASTENTSVSFGSVTSQETAQIVNSSAGYAQVGDTRETIPGWTLSINSTNFTSGGNTMPSSALSNTLGAPTGITSSGFTPGDVTAGASPLTFATAGQNYTLMTAANAKGHGGWRISNDLTLTVPAWQQASSTPYSATLTVTAS